MTHVLPEHEARILAEEWTDSLDFSDLGKFLRSDGQGAMLGILICDDGTIYKAYSGAYKKIFHSQEDFVPPCYDIEAMQNLLRESDEAVKKETNPARRAALSEFYNRKVQELYRFHCYDHRVRSLSDFRRIDFGAEITVPGFPCGSGQNIANPLTGQEPTSSTTPHGSGQNNRDPLPSAYPSGTGDCVEPKLLSFCYENGKRPLSMAAFYYGDNTKNISFRHDPTRTDPHGIADFRQKVPVRQISLLTPACETKKTHHEKDSPKPNSFFTSAYEAGKPIPATSSPVRQHGMFYPPCESRCQPILKHIIGLDIVYLDNNIVVVNKPEGLLSIEGKTEKDSVAMRVRDTLRSITQPCVHRLDQATSGLMVLALDEKSHRTLSCAFEKREVYKEYTAIVEGLITGESGVIDLPIRPDIENRPFQIVDHERGKKAVTKWERLQVIQNSSGVYTKLLLKPKTGRTHQLRMHCAYGLGHPILNDPLYGGGLEDSNKRNSRAAQNFINATCGAPDCRNASRTAADFKSDDSAESEIKNAPCHAQDFKTGNSAATPGFAENGIPPYRGDSEYLTPPLALRATLLRFRHPATGTEMTFSVPF